MMSVILTLVCLLFGFGVGFVLGIVWHADQHRKNAKLEELHIRVIAAAFAWQNSDPDDDDAWHGALSQLGNRLDDLRDALKRNGHG